MGDIQHQFGNIGYGLHGVGIYLFICLHVVANVMQESKIPNQTKGATSPTSAAIHPLMSESSVSGIPWQEK